MKTLILKDGSKMVVAPEMVEQMLAQGATIAPELDSVPMPKVGENATPEQRRKVREENQAGSMRIPDKFHKDGLEKDAKILAFPTKASRASGKPYVSCQLEIEGTKFCTLDPGDNFSEGEVVKVKFSATTNPNIASGFVCEVTK